MAKKGYMLKPTKRSKLKYRTPAELARLKRKHGSLGIKKK